MVNVANLTPVKLSSGVLLLTNAVFVWIRYQLKRGDIMRLTNLRVVMVHLLQRYHSGRMDKKVFMRMQRKLRNKIRAELKRVTQ